MNAGEILGRGRELEALESFVDDLAHGSAALVLEGDPGIGKTTLWNAAVAAAREREFRVLSCRPAGSEVQLSYAALGDLLDGLEEEALGALPSPQRRALEVALLLEDSPGPAPNRRAIALAVLGLLRVLAGEQPVLVAVDDAQWVDGPSAAALEFALRRLGPEPVGLLAAVRGDSDAGTLQAAFPQEACVRVGPLSMREVHRLVRSRLDLALPRPVLVRVHTESGGNPFYALELARALQSTEGVPPGGRLPVPDTLQDLLQERLAALPHPVREVLLPVAAMSDPTVSTVQAVIGRGRATSRLQAAASAGVLELDGERIAFTHPLLASTVYGQASADERRRVHRRLAGVVGDPEAQARHLALATASTDDDVAAALERAARLALGRGAPDAAAELLELAVGATPAEQDEDRRRRERGAAGAHFSSGAIERGTQILRGLADELPPGDERAGVLWRLATETVDLETALGLLEQARREVVADEELRCRIHLLLGTGWPLYGIDHALEHGRVALTYAEETRDRRLVVEVLARLSLSELWAGHDVSSLLDRATRLERRADGLRSLDSPRFPLAMWWMYQGRHDEARALFEELLAEGAAVGDETACLLLRGRMVDVELRAGNWREAAAHADTAFELAEQIGLEHDDGMSLYWKAFVDAHLGRRAEARAAAELGSELSRAANRENTLVMNLGVLGFLELSDGDEGAALPHLRPLLDWLERNNLALATHPIAPHALEALVGVGELQRFESEARVLESPWALAVAGRCRGTLAGAAGDLGAARRALEGALALHERGRWPFERARTFLVLGRVQRRERRKAVPKESFEHSLEIFERLGASLWAERAREELGRVGLRRPAPGGLTASERRVAELAASGLTNREVAAQLFVSPKTVEANLARAYRKLRIHSRAELGTWLASEEHEPAQT
jgi:DNA-binding CsgD family transcriptional regulator